MAKTNNYKATTTSATRDALAAYVVARDILAVEFDQINGKLRNVSTCLKTDLEDLDKVTRGEICGRTADEIRESMAVLRKKYDALKAEAAAKKEAFDTAIAPALNLLSVTGTTHINRKGEFVSSEDKKGVTVNKIFAAYHETIRTGDFLPYRKAVTNWLIACGVTPSESGVSYLLTVGGTRQNNGKDYIKERINGKLTMDKAAYAVTDSGQENFAKAFLNRVCRQAGDALPVRKLEYELTGKKRTNK